jgi:hypothetical protein
MTKGKHPSPTDADILSEDDFKRLRVSLKILTERFLAGERIRPRDSMDELEREQFDVARQASRDAMLEMMAALDDIPDEAVRVRAYSNLYRLFMSAFDFGRFTKPLGFAVKEISKDRAETARKGKEADIERRRKVIRDHFGGKLADSKTCAEAILKKCADEFEKAGVTAGLSASSIRRDVRAILSE